MVLISAKVALRFSSHTYITKSQQLSTTTSTIPNSAEKRGHLSMKQHEGLKLASLEIYVPYGDALCTSGGTQTWAS